MDPQLFFMWNPAFYRNLPKEMTKVEPEVHSLVFCNRCGCHYTDRCPEHSPEFAEPHKLGRR